MMKKNDDDDDDDDDDDVMLFHLLSSLHLSIHAMWRNSSQTSMFSIELLTNGWEPRLQAKVAFCFSRETLYDLLLLESVWKPWIPETRLDLTATVMNCAAY